MPLLNYTPWAVWTAKAMPVARAKSSYSVITWRAPALDQEPLNLAGPRTFVLPVNSGRVEAVLKRDKAPARYSTPEHAERVAWRIVKDWVEAQLAIIRTEMVTLDQVMLPYMRGEDGQTVYELYVNRQLALPAGSD